MKLSTERIKSCLPNPRAVRGLCAFLGMEHFIKWIDRTQAVFKQLKKALMRTPASDCQIAGDLLSYSLMSDKILPWEFQHDSQGHRDEPFRELLNGLWDKAGCSSSVLQVEQAGCPQTMLRYQGVLMEQDDPRATSGAGPAVFLLATKVGSAPEHEWLQAMEEVYSSLIQNPDWELYTDRNSFVCSGKHISGYVLTTQSQVSKDAAEKVIHALLPQWEMSLPDIKPEYTLEGRFQPCGWAVTPNGQVIFPEAIMRETVDSLHPGVQKIVKTPKKDIVLAKTSDIMQNYYIRVYSVIVWHSHTSSDDGGAIEQ
ncbi:hypothetical protein Nmel_011508 [Mimus melanotis]